MKMNKPGLAAFLFLQVPLSAGWLDRKAEGWAWYEEEEKKRIVEIAEEDIAPSAVEQLAAVKKNLELMFAEALLKPNHENIVNYLEAQKEWMDKSAAFANHWGKALLDRPDLDPTATTYATTQYGRQLQKTIEQEERTRLIKTVAQGHGLLFFYEGGSKASQAFAHVVKAFSDKYKWPVIGIAADGIVIPEIGGDPDQGWAARLGLEVLPALMAIASC